MSNLSQKYRNFKFPLIYTFILYNIMIVTVFHETDRGVRNMFAISPIVSLHFYNIHENQQ